MITKKKEKEGAKWGRSIHSFSCQSVCSFSWYLSPLSATSDAENSLRSLSATTCSQTNTIRSSTTPSKALLEAPSTQGCQKSFRHNFIITWLQNLFFAFFIQLKLLSRFFFKQKIVFPRLDKDYVLSCIWCPTFKIFNYDAMKLIQQVDIKTLFRKFCQISYFDIFPFFRRKQNSFRSNAPDWCLMKSINYHRLVQAFNG